MGNTVVRGRAPGVQLSGSFSDGVFVQNLGTSPVYMGYASSVSDANFDGVCAAGGSYTSSKGKALYAFATADTPIVFNNDTGASADAGTQVTAAVAGTVAVSSQPDTTLVPGQNVGATPQHSYRVLFPLTNVGPYAPNAFGTYVDTTDVSMYQTIVISALAGAAAIPASNSVIRVLVDWFDPFGNRLETENVIWWLAGGMHAVLPVKSTHCKIRYTVPGRNTDTQDVKISIIATTPALPEYFHCGAGSGAGVVINNVGMTINDLHADVSNGGTTELLFTSAAAGTSSATILLPSYNRRVVGTFVNLTSGGTVSGFQSFLWAYNYNSPNGATDSPIRALTVANAGDTLYFEAQFPKAPVYLNIKQSGTGGNQFQLGLNYEHF
jgi:hypothetical protein